MSVRAVHDDNSRDSTAEVIRGLMAEEPRVRGVFRQPPNGVGRALKDGYAAATGYPVELALDPYPQRPISRSKASPSSSPRAELCATSAARKLSRSPSIQIPT